MFTHHTRDAAPHHHVTVVEARTCEAGEHFTCHWLVERLPVVREPGADATSEDWDAYSDAMAYLAPQTVDCGAHAWTTPDGYACAYGHAHVNAEARHAQGWDYAHDEDEAKSLRRAGVDAVAMNGGSI